MRACAIQLQRRYGDASSRRPSLSVRRPLVEALTSCSPSTCWLARRMLETSSECCPILGATSPRSSTRTLPECASLLSACWKPPVSDRRAVSGQTQLHAADEMCAGPAGRRCTRLTSGRSTRSSSSTLKTRMQRCDALSARRGLRDGHDKQSGLTCFSRAGGGDAQGQNAAQDSAAPHEPRQKPRPADLPVQQPAGCLRDRGARHIQVHKCSASQPSAIVLPSQLSMLEPLGIYL